MTKSEIKRIAGLPALLCVFLATPGRAEVAVAAKAGTLGLGAEVTVGLSPRLNFRVGANGFNYSDRREASGIEYDAEAQLRTATGLLDLYPSGRGFHLTAGLVYNDTKVEGSSIAPPSGTYDIGGVPVPVSFVGTLDATADFDPIVPYVGLGWGNAVATSGNLGFYVDLGVVFQGEADITLIPILPANSPINTTPGARQAFDILLRREEQDLEDEASDYDYYPVLSFGLSYRF
ncbi:MAG TPA: hypothetical protein VHC97_27210 [Thermoanaerobaculia bacterium]|jgi:hypothetical protein|nr:hypothetical protein [Thermoanaerobaculia bacterium]